MSFLDDEFFVVIHASRIFSYKYKFTYECGQKNRIRGCRSSIKSFPFFAVHPRVMSSRLNSSSKFRHGASCFTMPYATRIDFEFLHFVAGSSANSSSIFSTRYSLENSAMQTMLLNIYIYSSLTIRSRLVFVCNNEIETVIRYMG